MKPRPARQRGFSLLIVVLLLALGAITAVIVLSLVHTEAQIMGLDRQARQARAGAEGAAMEVLNDRQLVDYLPTFQDDELEVTYQKSSNSAFDRSVQGNLDELRYEAKIAMLRTTPIHESSLSVTRAFVYEVQVESEINGGDATDAVHAEVFKVFTMPAGTVLPERHAR